jgi:Asp-tRNA(Asn)/Glu-tRNA(Gln) amidotransferase A subunit family amidase
VTSPFVSGPLRIAGATSGTLTGLTFAAKDLFDVAGHPTGGGNPDWARQNPVPTRHAWAVQRLLGAGATLIGKTITDEVSLGILGENPFDGTPLNPRAPARVPGGSSSGSASAVAQGLCDTALTTLDPLRARISCLTSHGGLTGSPQVSLPGAHVDGLPVGLSILGARGSDAVLVAVAKAMEDRRRSR